MARLPSIFVPSSLTLTHTLAGLRRMPDSKEVTKTATRA